MKVRNKTELLIAVPQTTDTQATSFLIDIASQNNLQHCQEHGRSKPHSFWQTSHTLLSLLHEAMKSQIIWCLPRTQKAKGKKSFHIRCMPCRGQWQKPVRQWSKPCLVWCKKQACLAVSHLRYNESDGSFFTNCLAQSSQYIGLLLQDRPKWSRFDKFQKINICRSPEEQKTKTAIFRFRIYLFNLFLLMPIFDFF